MKYARDIKLAVFYARQYKWLTISTILVLIASSVFEGISIGMIIPILQSLLEKVKSNFFITYIQSFFAAIHVEYNFVNLLIFFGLIMFLKFGMIALQQYLTRAVSASVTCELREKAFENLMRVPLSYYYRYKVGDIVATVYTSSNRAGAVVELFMQLLVGLLTILVYIAINLMISVPLTVSVCLLAVFSYFLVIPRFRMGFTHGKEEKEITDRLSSFLLDKLGGIKTVKAFNNEKLHIADFGKLALSFKRVQIKIQNNRILAGIYLESLVIMVIIGLMIFSVEILHISLISLLVLFYIFSRIMPKIKLINSVYLDILSFLPHFSKVQEIIERKNKIYLSEGVKGIESLKKGIEFERVSFKYPGTEEYAVKNITISIEKNKTTALVGASGGGKTTLVDLILRHHDPEKGVIKIDGVPLYEIKRKDWHLLVGMVEQEAYLFNDTIYNNIIYGKPDAGQDKVTAIAKLANAHDFIQKLPAGYNTLVGERGMKLSGGQKQRISLARALIKDPDILILDEATSALDSESERLIQESIEKIGRTKTIIVIAHRLSTIINADVVIVIEKGEVVEEGTPEELLQKDGVYRKYYSLHYGR